MDWRCVFGHQWTIPKYDAELTWNTSGGGKVRLRGDMWDCFQCGLVEIRNARWGEEGLYGDRRRRTVLSGTAVEISQ